MSNAFRILARASTRGMIREPLVGFSAITLFAVYLAIYIALTFAFGMSGPGGPDLLHDNLGLTLTIGLLGIGLIGTAVPVIDMRGRGLLRLLGTTPVRRSTFLLAQLPAPLMLVAVEVMIVVIVAVVRGYLDPATLPGFSVSTAAAVIFTFGAAALAGARATRAAVAQQNLVMLALILVGLSGGVFPVTEAPVWVQTATHVLPTAWVGAALNAGLTGAVPFAPLPLLWLGITAVGIGMFVVGARRFSWDQRTIADAPGQASGDHGAGRTSRAVGAMSG